MRKSVFIASLVLVFAGLAACSKNSTTSNAKTVANISGSYNIIALTAVFSGISINLYDSLKPCEKDNLIQLNADLSAKFIDAGTVCAPPEDSTGTWRLSSAGDTLTLAGSPNYIKSWDGKTLVLTTHEDVSGFPVVATTTLSKK